MQNMKKFLAVFLAVILAAAPGPERVLASQQVQEAAVLSFSSEGFFSFFFSGKRKKSMAKSGERTVVVLDAGHGGSDGGAGGNGLAEKELNLRIAQYCKEELEKYQGLTVYMTRVKDTYVGLAQRVDYAASVNADLFVSLHINSAASQAASGAEVFYPNSNYRPDCSAKGKKTASAILQNLAGLGLKNRGLKVMNSMNGSTYPDGSPSDYYAVIRGSKQCGIPGIIVEHAFISNAMDAGVYLGSSAALKKLGIADAKGIASSLGLEKSGDETTSALQKTNFVRLSGSSSFRAYMEWKPVEGAMGYEIYRSSFAKGEFEKIITIEQQDAAAYTDVTGKNGEIYFYKIRPYCINGGQRETPGFSPVQKVKLLKKPQISVRLQSARLKISWKNVSGALKYQIYRSISKEGKFQKIATVSGVNSYQDNSREMNRTYYYKVRAVGAGIRGNTYSSYSTVKCVTEG